MRLQFGECLFDSETRELFRSGEAVHLSPKAFRVLELLLENRPKAMSKAQIHEVVWPDTFVSEATLASLIAEIRSAVGEEGREARLIRTVHGYGYAFQGTVATARGSRPDLRPAVAFRLEWAGREMSLNEGENILGRDRDVTVWVDDPSVSRRHARIVISGETAALEDLQSKNGTFLAGKPVKDPVPVENGAEIRLGGVSLVFRLHREAGSTATQINP